MLEAPQNKFMKSLLLIPALSFYFLLAGSFNFFSQNLDWVKTINASFQYSGDINMNDVCIDDNNKQYSISSAAGNSILFNYNPTMAQGNVIIKSNSLGNSSWFKCFPPLSNAGCEPKKSFYHNGNIYIAGIKNGTVDMDPGPSVYNLYGATAFIVKIDTLGNFIWAKSFGSVGANVTDLKVDTNENVFITGSFSTSFSFNSVLQTSNGNEDVYLLKYNNQGQEQWCKTFGSNSINSEAGNSIAIDSNADILVAGNFSGTVDFDAGTGSFLLTSVGNRTGFITKYNQNGSHLITVKFDGANNASESRLNSIDIQNSSIYVTGLIYGTIDMDPGTLISNETLYNSGFILKLDPQFNLIWNKIISTTGGSEGTIVKTKFNEVYLSGFMSGTTDLDPDPTNSFIYSNNGTYIVKLHENGNFIWGAGFLNTSDPSTSNTYSYINYPKGMAIANNAVYIVGGFKGPVDFNPDFSITQVTQSALTPSGIGLTSGYLVKLTNCISSNTSFQINSCGSYLWSQTGQTYTNSGTYNDTLQNAGGCDSTITLTLTITPSSINTIAASACDSYLWNGQTYTQSGVYSGPTANCVTETLDLTITPSSINTTTAAACNSFTWNGQTYTQSGVYSGPTANCVTESLNLTINSSSSASQTQTALDTYTWPLNNQTYTQGGTYTATIPNAAGCDSVVTLNLTLNYTSINELIGSRVSISPNPTSSKITVTASLALIGKEFTIYDQQGKAVKLGIITAEETEIDLSNLSEGVYLFKAGAEMQETFKIIKQ